MKLYIIGNGFDRGHNLPTSYWDFRMFLENAHPEFLASFEEHYGIYSGMTDSDKGLLLWNEFETNLVNIDEGTIIDNAVRIDMDLESGDVGIKDTLYYFFSEEYAHIRKLPAYLKQWVRTIKIRDTQKRTSLITNDSIYLTFNYTAVLENVYGIEASRITHIHGSLRDYDIDPVIGHGNQARIQNIHNQKEEAQNLFDEKWESICSVIEEYYRNTLKDVDKYSYALHKLSGKDIDEIFVIGHSLAGVDMPYFREIDSLTENKLSWNVYFYNPDEQAKFKANLISVGIEESRIHLIPATEFYNL